MNLFPTVELMTEYRPALSAKKYPIDFRNIQKPEITQSRFIGRLS